LIIDDKTKDAVIVDPAHPPEYVGNSGMKCGEMFHANLFRVLPVLEKEISENGINLKAIINTHQ